LPHAAVVPEHQPGSPGGPPGQLYQMEERGLRQDRRRSVRHRHEGYGQTYGTLPPGHGDLDSRTARYPFNALLPPYSHEYHVLEELAHSREPLCQRCLLALDVCYGVVEPPANPVAGWSGFT